MGKIVRCILIGILSAGCILARGRERGLQIVEKNTVDLQSPLYRKSYALVVGISDYMHWPKLANATRDAREVAYKLTEHGFHVTLLLDPNREKLEEALHTFVFTHGSNPQDRLLFYFAGHGHTMKMSYGSDEGFVIPLDAPIPHEDNSEFLKNALSMHSFANHARQIQSKHVLYVFDCCFSGSVFSSVRSLPLAIDYKTSKPVRQFITAGEAMETVSDKSIFSYQFIAGLNGEGDSNQDGFITGTELGEFLQTTVVNYSGGTQHPQYGKISDPNLDKGDFVFIAPTQDNVQHKSKKEWNHYLSQMKKQLLVAHDVHTNNKFSDEKRIETWKSFLLAYAGDNPHSSKDNRIRHFATLRLDELSPETPLPSLIIQDDQDKQEIENIYHEIKKEPMGHTLFFHIGTYYHHRDEQTFFGFNGDYRIYSHFGVSIQYGVSAHRHYMPKQSRQRFVLAGPVFYFKNVAKFNLQAGYLSNNSLQHIFDHESGETYCFMISTMFRIYENIYCGPSLGWQPGIHSIRDAELPEKRDLNFGISVGVGI